MIFRTFLMAGFISGKKFNICRSLGSKTILVGGCLGLVSNMISLGLENILVNGLLVLVSNMIILLQTSAFTFRVPSRNLIFGATLQAGFISGMKFNFCKSLGSQSTLVGGLLGLV